MTPIRKTEYIEVVIDNISKKEFKFPQNLSIMEGSKVLTIEAIKNSIHPISPLSGKTIVSDAAFKSSFLTLRTHGSKADDISLYPLSSLDTPNNNGVVKEFDKIHVDFGQSKITVADLTTLAGQVGNVFAFVVVYESIKEKC